MVYFNVLPRRDFDEYAQFAANFGTRFHRHSVCVHIQSILIPYANSIRKYDDDDSSSDDDNDDDDEDDADEDDEVCRRSYPLLIDSIMLTKNKSSPDEHEDEDDDDNEDDDDDEDDNEDPHGRTFVSSVFICIAHISHTDQIVIR